ncbi:MAG: hypothetical protein QM778_18255 [Myxococcales bacterium]
MSRIDRVLTTVALAALCMVGCSHDFKTTPIPLPKSRLQALADHVKTCTQTTEAGSQGPIRELIFGVTIADGGAPRDVAILEIQPRNLELESCVLRVLLAEHFDWWSGGYCVVGQLRGDDPKQQVITAPVVSPMGTAWCERPYAYPVVPER